MERKIEPSSGVGAAGADELADGLLARVEELLGKATALAGGAALAITALEKNAQGLHRIGKTLSDNFGGAGRKGNKVLRKSARYLRKHPVQSAALLAAAGVLAALQVSRDRPAARAGSPRARPGTARASGDGAGRVRTTQPATQITTR